jgi:hypothetical protein
MKKSTLMLLVGAAVAFFGYRYWQKKNAVPAAAATAAVPDQSTPGDNWFSGGAPTGGGYADTGVASADISQVQPATQVSNVQPVATVNQVSQASDGVKGPVIPPLVQYKGIARPLVVNYTGTGIDVSIYTLKSGMMVGGFVNNSGTYTISSIPKNPYYVPATLMVPVSDLNIPAQV